MAYVRKTKDEYIVQGNFAKGTKKVIDLFKVQSGFSKRWAVKVV